MVTLTQKTTIGFHPLIAFDGITGHFLKAQLRQGNVYTSNGIIEFIRPLIEHYKEKFPKRAYFYMEIVDLLSLLYMICVKGDLFSTILFRFFHI